MKAARVFLALGALLILVSAAQAKRSAPAPVRAVVIGGVSYEARQWGIGGSGPGGYVVAVDRRSGKELWTARVYDTPRTDEIEGDKQDVFITRLQAASGGRALIVENEMGRRFVLDLATRGVSAEK